MWDDHYEADENKYMMDELTGVESLMIQEFIKKIIRNQIYKNQSFC
jgi:hypothetical protein